MTEPVGTLAEEAAKLLGAADAWWRRHAAPAPEQAAAGHAAPGHAAPEQAAAECRVCPFCQVLSVVRSAQPELFERLSEAALALVATLKPETPDAAPRRADVPVEHIDIA